MGLNNGVGIGDPNKRKKKASPAGRSRRRVGRASSSNSRQKWGSDWTIEPAEQSNGGLMNAVNNCNKAGAIQEDLIHLGTLGFPTDSLDVEVRNDIAEKLEQDHDAITVFVSDTDYDGHYSHFCKTILWPLFHYQIPDHPKSKAYQDHSYRYYEALNQAFADKIVDNYKRGDIIWVNDYHLLLVPAMVRKRLPDAKIAFFLHAAFPSSEVFRCLGVRKQLLEGMLGANVIGFQCPEYQEHFLTTCSRLLIVETLPNGVQLDDRFINVVSNPIGIDPDEFQHVCKDGEVSEWITTLSEKYKGKKIIVARDKLDMVRGVRQKLLSFELFLNKYPQYKDQVVLIQVATTTTEDKQLSEIISTIVSRIDAQHATLSHQPLVFLRQDLPFAQYLALLSVADVMMITSLREGMNLTCHEYILCQDGSQSSKKHGPVILSEFTGSSALFEGNNLSINPWDYRDTAEKIKQALEMTDAQKEASYSELHKIVCNKTGRKWVIKTIEDLNKFHTQHQQRDTSSIPRLAFTPLSEAYARAKHRLFFLDYDGTLANFPSANTVHINYPQRVVETLKHLLADDRNTVYVMSHRTPEELERIFTYLPGVGLVAENGCFVREFKEPDVWLAFADADAMAGWKSDVKRILEYYRDRLEGSSIEERHCSVTFWYDSVKAEDRESAVRQAGDCANHINDACASHAIHAVPVENGVLVEPTEWTKASAAARVFEDLREKAPKGSGLPDFLFVAGDDREDEVVYKWANKLDEDGLVKDVVSVSLGKRNTEAGATLTQGTSGNDSVYSKATQR